MIRTYLHRFILTGSAIVAMTLALPFPLFGAAQETPLDTISSKASVEYPPHRIVVSLKENTLTNNSSSGLISALTTARLRVENQLADTHDEQPITATENKPADTQEQLQGEINTQPAKASITPVLTAMLEVPEAISLHGAPIGTDNNRKQALKDVAPSLLVEERQSTNGDETASTSQPVQQVQEGVKEEETVPTKAPVVGTAERIEVPGIGIDLSVVSGAYDSATGTWTVDDTSAFHASTTVPVNDTNGTTLIYGHAKWGIFGNLPDIQSGAEAIIYTVEGLKFVYTFESVRQVDPADVSMLTVEGEPTLVLQTCSGLLDQHRTLATFRLKEIIHI